MAIDKLLGPAEEVPEYYVDSVRMALNVYSVILELGMQRVKDTLGSEPPQTKRLAVVRMSPQHALVLMKLLEKNLNAYQKEIGKIAIPDDLYRNLLGQEPPGN